LALGLSCNIGRSGRLLRIATGALFVFNGIVLYKLNLPDKSIASHALQLFFIVSGLFCIFEGIAGWCALRALGMKTKL
jgi:hypothetical protein